MHRPEFLALCESLSSCGVQGKEGAVEFFEQHCDTRNQINKEALVYYLQTCLSNGEDQVLHDKFFIQEQLLALYREALGGFDDRCREEQELLRDLKRLTCLSLSIIAVWILSLISVLNLFC